MYAFHNDMENHLFERGLSWFLAVMSNWKFFLCISLCPVPKYQIILLFLTGSATLSETILTRTAVYGNFRISKSVCSSCMSESL